MAVARKTEIEPVNGTPVKRMFWSIISDYDLKTGLCELIDNAIDLWTLSTPKGKLAIIITLDADRQFISVRDNAGGIKEEELKLLIAPGGSKNDPYAEMIGIFGVGGKRASIALGEHVEIKTRHKNQGSFQLDITKDWLEIDDWEIPAYAIPHIEPETTRVEISQLRKSFTHTNVEEISQHLSETYAWFLKQGCTITLNDTKLKPQVFDAWAYPKGYPPRHAPFALVGSYGLGMFQQNFPLNVSRGLRRSTRCTREQPYSRPTPRSPTSLRPQGG